MVRYEEVLESIKMIEQLVKDMPKTPIVVEEHEFKPLGMGIGYTEAPRGENMHFVILGKDNKVYRWKVRSPTYNNIPSLYIMLKNHYLADAPAIIASIDPCFSCTDRVIVVDIRNRSRRILNLSYINRYVGR